MQRLESPQIYLNVLDGNSSNMVQCASGPSLQRKTLNTTFPQTSRPTCSLHASSTASSTSKHEMFSPQRMMISLARPTIVRCPSSSNLPRSPEFERLAGSEYRYAGGLAGRGELASVSKCTTCFQRTSLCSRGICSRGVDQRKRIGFWHPLWFALSSNKLIKTGQIFP